MTCLKSTVSNLSKCNVSCMRKKILGPKMYYLHYVWQEFEKNIVILKFSTLFKCKVSCKQKKLQNWNQKLAFFGIFKVELEETTVIFEAIPPPFHISQIGNFCTIQKNIKFWTKNALFGCNFKKLWSNLKSAHSNF